MKKVKVLAIAFVIGSSSLLASTVNNPNPFLNDCKHPIKKSSVEKKNKAAKAKVVIKNELDSEKKHISNKNIQLYNLNYNNKALLEKEMQIKAVKAYSYIMPEIIGKE